MKLADNISICNLLPHDADMCLLDEMIEVDENKIICSSLSHLKAQHPLRVNGKLYNMSGIEYASQVIALHGQIERLKTQSKPLIGFLASIRNVEMHTRLLDEDEGVLMIEAMQLMRIDGAVTYEFSITSPVRLLMSGRLTTKLMMEIPEK